jgi:hypothetical protein
MLGIKASKAAGLNDLKLAHARLLAKLAKSTVSK